MPVFEDNLARVLRMRNLFAPENMVGGPPSQGPNLSSNQPGFPYAMNMNAGPNPQSVTPSGVDYTPDTRAEDKMWEMVNKFPQRQKPGLLRKIAASAIGFGGGPQAADQALNQPYYQQLQDWQNQFKALQPLAAEERAGNTNLRMISAQAARDKYNDERLQQAAEREVRIASQGQQRISQADKRIEIAQKQAKGGQLQFMDDGSALMVYKDGTVEPIDANLFSPQEKEAALQKNRVALAQVPRTTFTSGSTTTQTVTPPGAEDPTQAKVRKYNRAQEAFNSKDHPEWRQYINLNDPGTNEFTVSQPSSGFFGMGGADNKEWDNWKAMIDFINQPGQAIPGKTSTSARSTTSTSTRGVAATPRQTAPVSQSPIRVRNPKTGKEGAFKGTVEEAKKAGYEVIK